MSGLGALRNTVRQALVARQLDEQIAAHFPVGRRLRVLDVGLGQGTQALRLARAGHEVTGLESDPAMLDAVRAALSREPAGIRERMRLIEGDGRDTGAHFLPGAFDVVLCHGVLMYVPEPDPMLAALARVLAPGGLLSLLVRNADALALRPGLSGDWDAALAAFDSPAYTNRIGLAARADRREALTTTLTAIGTPLHTWYGVRVFTDLTPDTRVSRRGAPLSKGRTPAGCEERAAEAAIDLRLPPRGRPSTGAEAPRRGHLPAVAGGEPSPEKGAPVPEDWDRLLAAEDRAGRTDPYRAVAALLHLCGVRG